MTVFDWLDTMIGIQFTHAVILLILAIAAWFARQAHSAAQDARNQSAENARLLNGHLEQHILDIASPQRPHHNP